MLFQFQIFFFLNFLKMYGDIYPFDQRLFKGHFILSHITGVYLGKLWFYKLIFEFHSVLFFSSNILLAWVEMGFAFETLIFPIQSAKRFLLLISINVSKCLFSPLGEQSIEKSILWQMNSNMILHMNYLTKVIFILEGEDLR